MARETEAGLRWALASLCRGVVERDLLGPLSSGNASIAADGGGALAITASGVAFRDAEPGNIVILEVDDAWGTPTGSGVRSGKEHTVASSELLLHLAVYRTLPAVRVVLHLHAPWIVAASCLAGERLPLVHYHQALLGARSTPVVAYATPGTEELAALTGEALASGDVDAVLLGSHGAVVVGATPDLALDRAEVLEDVCRLVVLTHGRARELEPSELSRLRNLLRAYRRG